MIPPKVRQTFGGIALFPFIGAISGEGLFQNFSFFRALILSPVAVSIFRRFFFYFLLVSAFYSFYFTIEFCCCARTARSRFFRILLMRQKNTTVETIPPTRSETGSA